MRSFLFLSMLAVLFLGTESQASPFVGSIAGPGSVHRMLDRALMEGKKPRYTVELGFEYLHTSLKPFEGIVLENATTSSNASTVTGNLDSEYPDVFAQMLKIQILWDEESRWVSTVKSYLPLNAIAQIDTGYIYLPEYVLYRAEMQRPRIQVGLGRDFGRDWRLGLGVDVGFQVTTTANVFLQNGSGKLSDQRISARLKPSFVPQMSVQYQNTEFVIRSENKIPFELQTNAGARVFSGGAGVDFSYRSQSAIYFDPWSFELRTALQVLEATTIRPGVAYQLWSRYQARAATIAGDITNNCNGNAGCSTVFAPTGSPEFAARNLLVPELSIDQQLGDHHIDFGYRFKDSIFSGLPTGAGNYLDPPRHDLWLGLRWITSRGWEIGVNLQGSFLMTQTVVKSDPSQMGGPSYQAGGTLIGGGVRLAVPF
jgi:hypothetical protein